MNYTPLTPNRLTVEQRNHLINQIATLFTANGALPRGVIDMRGKTIPSGKNVLGKLLKQYPLEGVRCDIAGTVLTVEITTKRQGLQEESTVDSEGMRYATSNYEEFRDWFFGMLKSSGIEPKQASSVASTVTPTKRPSTIKMDLRKPPHIANRRSNR